VDELARKLESLRHEVVPPWDAERRGRAYAAVTRMQRRQRLRRVTMSASAAVLAACVLVYLRWPSHLGGDQSRLAGASPPEVKQPSADPKPNSGSNLVKTAAPGDVLAPGQRARLADGSDAQITSAQGELLIKINEPDRLDLHLLAGSAHFEVVPNTRRQFSVVAGAVEVIVVGTAFDVERADGRVRVAVAHGKVRVHTLLGVAFVQAGESRWFDQGDAPAAAPASASLRRPSSLAAPTFKARERGSRATSSVVRAEASRVDWRSLNQSGDYEGAYRLLAQGAALSDDSEALMDAADAARLSNHPEAAEKYLRKVLRDHRESPATPLAAFSLGRVLLERLGRPSEAAEAFATARELAPEGSLAQDALAREVEAWSKAGHAQEAYQRARTFVERYPESRRLRVVQLYGGLRAP
jgi:transmembrane sensor